MLIAPADLATLLIEVVGVTLTGVIVVVHLVRLGRPK